MTLKVKTLFISPEFSIDEAIEDRLAFLGHQVTRIKDRPTNNVIASSCSSPSVNAYFFDTYYERKLKELQTDLTMFWLLTVKLYRPILFPR